MVALSILRELGPVLTAILVGGKVASGITAELGSMKVTEQIDALRALGVNYVKKLIVPRFMAALLVFPLVTILADGMGLLGGMLIAVFDRNVDPYLYWNTIAYWVVLKDFLTGLGKSVVFGGLVTLIGCYNGLATEGGHRGARPLHHRDGGAGGHGRDHLRLLPHAGSSSSCSGEPR